jgi:hypothetical protein
MKLVALEGLAPGTEYTLEQRTITLGRTASCDVVLDDDDVSREHCRISPRDDGYVIEDLDSSNGTIVNGQLIQSPAYLRPGDLVVIGRALFEVRGSAPEPRPAVVTGRKSRPRPPESAAPVAPDQLGGAVTDLASALREAALAGHRLESRLEALSDHLGGVDTGVGELTDALDLGDEEEARRLLALCRGGASSDDTGSRVRTLEREAAALYQTVTAAVELLAAIRGS